MPDQARNLVWALIVELEQKTSQLGEYAMLIAALAAQISTCNYERLLAIGEQLNPRKTERTNKPGRIKQTDAINLFARLRDHAKAVLHFLRNPKVPFTNNTGERAVRMPKGKQKVAGCFRSVLGAEYYFTIRSYLDTLSNKDIVFLMLC